jgi:hypothetical protein
VETLSESRPVFPLLSDGHWAQAEVVPPPGKLESLRKRLASTLPSQADVDFLLSSSHGWWLIQQHMMIHLPDTTENDSHGMFNVSAISQGHPITITRLLFRVAIRIQQLPPEMDTRKFQTKVPLRETMSSIIEFLIQNVTSDDEKLQALKELNVWPFREYTRSMLVTFGKHGLPIEWLSR